MPEDKGEAFGNPTASACVGAARQARYARLLHYILQCAAGPFDMLHIRVERNDLLRSGARPLARTEGPLSGNFPAGNAPEQNVNNDRSTSK